jgi:hypothetical protein
MTFASSALRLRERQKHPRERSAASLSWTLRADDADLIAAGRHAVANASGSGRLVRGSIRAGEVARESVSPHKC